MIAECQQTLASGNKCRAIALRGKPHCRHHAPSPRQSPRRNHIRVTRLLGPVPEITTRKELRQMLTQTLQALADGSISVYRVQALLTSLQMIAKTL